ncbi:unnamed protein product [Prorocentrum cordatum]|uniref:Uncharacterized protein n=1 Tax=Prorocentrum cordatum TaxID=2364126 RepID=A0ABN9SZ79_9DINO|nr:unnamed protein product [Polarella glacialis]
MYCFVRCQYQHVRAITCECNAMTDHQWSCSSGIRIGAHVPWSDPHEPFDYSAVVELCFAMGRGVGPTEKVAGAEVAKAVIADADKLRPPDIGKLFVALHEKKWFTDPMAEGYLTESLVAQIQNLKKQDQGLDQIVQQSVKEQEAAAAA